MEDNRKLYKIFGLDSNFDLQQLKNSFKKLVIALHPDKGGNKDEFNFVSAAYKKLYFEHELRKSTKEFNELKETFSEFKSHQDGERKQNVHIDTTKSRNDMDEKFSDRFNKVFTDNRLHNPLTDNGYGDKMVKSSKYREDYEEQKSLKGEKFNVKRFNKDFNNIRPIREKTDVIKYVEPQALQSSGDKLTFVELGINEINDYSSSMKTYKDLNYSYYMKAHETNKLIDVDETKKRKHFKNLQHLENSRDNQSFEMTREERKYYDDTKKENELNEYKRVQRMLSQDKMYTVHYEKVNKLFVK